MKHAALAVALGLGFGLAPVASAHHGGECYVSANNSHICVVRTGQREFSAAITDGTSVQPTVLALHCNDGWRGAGALSEKAMELVVEAICLDIAHKKAPPLLWQGCSEYEGYGLPVVLTPLLRRQQGLA